MASNLKRKSGFFQKAALTASFLLSSGCANTDLYTAAPVDAADSLNPCSNDDNKNKLSVQFTFEDQPSILLFNTKGIGTFHPDKSGIIEKFYEALGRHNVTLQNPKNIQAYNIWMSQVDLLGSSNIKIKAKKVHELVIENITYKSDPKTVGNKDHWNAPVETIARGLGDCEDMALLKYFTLRYLGVPADQMYIIVTGLGPSSSLNHAALVVDTKKESDERYIVLGGNTPNPSFSYMKETKDIKIFYAMNETGLWTFPENTHKYNSREMPLRERAACLERRKLTKKI